MRPAQRSLPTVVAAGLLAAACTSTDSVDDATESDRAVPPSRSRPTTAISTQPPPTAVPVDLTANRVRALPVAHRPLVTPIGTVTVPGIDNANPSSDGITADGRVFVEHLDINVEQAERLRLTGIQMVDPRTGERHTLTNGFPRRTQVISMDSQGPWVTWVESDSIYLGTAAGACTRGTPRPASTASSPTSTTWVGCAGHPTATTPSLFGAIERGSSPSIPMLAPGSRSTPSPSKVVGSATRPTVRSIPSWSGTA